MATSSVTIMTGVRQFCATCVRGSQRFVGRYRDFLLDPGTLFTLASFLLLVIAVALKPSGLVNAHDAHSLWYLAAALVGSVYIWWSAIQGIREGDFTADIPVSLATAAALIIGQYSAAAVVAVLLLVGGMLEEFVSARAGNALDALAKLLPDQVLVRHNGQDLPVPLADVLVGDIVIIRSGERIPIDGIVLTGTSSINQAAITGESVPVDKGVGNTVFAGTLNEVGALEIQATKVGEETTLGQIRRMVAEAQKQKAPIERILNTYAKFYTPAAILIGIVLFLVTHDILRSITVLIVFCPCVMVLATPTALVASIGNAALRGSLVKKGATVEALAKVTTIAFDKTGTLTLGQPQLQAVLPLAPTHDEQSVLRLAAIAEKLSEHPLGQAVVRAAQKQDAPLPDPERFQVLPGLGVEATIGTDTILLGRPLLLQEQGVDLSAAVLAQVNHQAANGRTVLVIACNRQVIGLLVLEDTLRPQAQSVIARLKEMGIQTVLITGDNTATAQRIADKLGISTVHAEVLPQQKVAIVQQLQDAGQVVAFVGDGVNDGPALATAQVGVAMGLGGTDVAIETAEIALLSDDLTKLPHLLRLSRQAMRAIRQNLAFSLGVLAIAVSLAVVGILQPVTGALLHELSSIPVIMNSARLIGIRERA